MEEKDFGDFEETGQEEQEEQETQVARARMPRGRELIGVIIERLGGNRMHVHSTDGKIRNSRVPGRYKRRLWLRPKDIVIVVPWEDDEKKADVIYKYRPAEIIQLKKQGLLNSIKDEF
ncbi:hypothetical protein AUJ84_04570 [Candidatus Pacearchaeota archaeon CG1_02_32_132]|nr:MAG: hypothetical protein AUJ84_04570 [Candidatus Pacearchaeota archaeon CG1_02_32_132]